MKIMILGLGVIGTTYGYAFQKAGHTVEHFIRDSKRDTAPKSLDVKLLDGRYNNKGQAKTDTYDVVLAKSDSAFDFILISVSTGKLEAAIKSLNENHITGTIILFNGIWEEKADVDRILGDRKYILGYPVAGGSLKDNMLDCVLFDHIMLECRKKSDIVNYDELISLLSEADIKPEIPFDMLEWIWIHMAINAGVITTAGKYGDVTDTAKAAESVMNSSKALSDAVLSIREATKIVATRGVNLKHYNNELLPYKIPSKIAGVIMKHMFANNELTRRIMMLHSNIGDLLYVCRNVYECGKQNYVKAPIFYSNYEGIEKVLNAK